ncbi:hypothetical protein, partial [Streptomyces sp. NPDC006285]|uniref:hypothetical protein n=1 Tax=Streptomyces sp. NPDC006285 TaxID=3364742 RepID=UPI0036CB2386
SCLRVTILFLPDPHSRRIRIGKIDHDATQALVLEDAGNSVLAMRLLGARATGDLAFRLLAF